nr:hypothetical protein [uncultured Flavobacterium sp.]
MRQSDSKILKGLWCYHLLFAFVYAQFFTGDANYYWEVAAAMDYETFSENLTTKLGTYFIFSFNYFPASYLGMSYLAGTILHALYGFIGLCCFYALTVKLVPKNSFLGKIKLFPFLFFLPNLHFWSVAVGKDSTSFLFVGLIFYSFLNIKRRLALASIGFLFLYLIRPHVALFVFVAMGLSFLISKHASKAQRIFLSALILAAAIAILPKVLEYSNIESLSTENIDSFTSERTGNLSRSHTESRVDISSYPFPIKVFTFLFRPLFFDINNITALLASIENLILLVLFIKTLKQKPLKTLKAAPLQIQALAIFLVLGTLAFSQTLSNLGIMLRMRNMFLPALIIIILWSNSYNPKKIK